MGDEQTLSAEEQLRLSHEQFEAGQDFTLSIEEEFALLDPDTHDMVNRFEEIEAAVRGTELQKDFAGELIASEVEIKTGRCETFAEAADKLAERRGQLIEVVDRLGIALGGTGTHPWSSWKDQRIIDTPHYRRNDELLRYVTWRNNTFGLHVHIGIRGADRAVAVCSALRSYLPDLLAVSASSPFIENCVTHLHSARSQTFTKMFPRCGIPDPFASWAEYEGFLRYLYATGSMTEHTQLWWSIRLHLAFPTVEVRICDAQPELAEARALAALIYALTARVARAVDEGEQLAIHPDRLIEENFWRAIRYGLTGELLDLNRMDELRVRPARVAAEELVEWVLPVAEELGLSRELEIPRANAAERQLAASEAGATLAEIYAQQVTRTHDAAFEAAHG
ncbi:MAG: YbdK family carboxylate-amine ligase [Actinomycetia bacterium]|nr:YbdK family carboxylate-amine ligase [Actinomycetes bacterium]